MTVSRRFFTERIGCLGLGLAVMNPHPQTQLVSQPITSTQTPVETVQAYYTALENGDFNGVLAVVAEDGVLEEPASLPYTGTYRGRADWRRFGERFNTVWQDPMITVESIADAGEFVIGLARLQATARQTKRTIDMPLAELFWVKDGKITKLLPFYWDTAAAVNAMTD